MDYAKESLKMHYELRGKLEVTSRAAVDTKDALSLAYTPGVAAPCLEIQKDVNKSYELTRRWNTVAVVTDGTAVLGLGDIGPEAGMPVMEGKAVLYKKFGDVDSVPICIDTKDPKEFVNIVEKLQPSFGGINLEDISSPKCYEIEAELIKRCHIPVFHDDQHGTAIIACAAVSGALRYVKKDISQVKVVVNGCGAAGSAIGKLLYRLGVKNLIMIDIDGAVYEGRPGEMDMATAYLASVTNPEHYKGNLAGAVKGADVLMQPEHKVIGSCPACGSDVCETAKGWFCRDKSCKFALWKENRFFQTLGKQMTEELAKQLVNQGKARLTHCYSKKSGRYYDTTVHVETGEDGAAAFKLEFGGKK